MKTLQSSDITAALKRHEQRDSPFRNEWTEFWATPFGSLCRCAIWACVAFLAIILALDWTGALPIVGGRN